jgi:hypothetical protein
MTTSNYRIWVAHCLFKKNGFPSLGTFGASEAPVVIMTLKIWEQLCKDVPQLQTTNFEVGSQE